MEQSTADSGPPTPAALAQVADPRFLTALAVLAFNDAVLKEHFASLLSGKLSDFAGLIVFPVALSAVLDLLKIKMRPELVVGAVCAWFVAIQISLPASALHEHLLGLVLPWTPDNVADPTDLLATPMAIVAYRVISAPQPITFARYQRVAIVTLAALVCLGDSGPPQAYVGPAVSRDDGVVEVRISNDLWEFSSDEAADENGILRVDTFSEEARSLDPLSEVCLESDPLHCFRVGDSNFRFEETTDGVNWDETWSNTRDKHLLNEPHNQERPNAGSVAVTANDTIVATTSTGPMLTWTADGGWSPGEFQVRNKALVPFLMLLGLAGASTALLFWIGSKKGRDLIFIATTLLVLAGASALTVVVTLPFGWAGMILAVLVGLALMVAGITTAQLCDRLRSKPHNAVAIGASAGIAIAVLLLWYVFVAISLQTASFILALLPLIPYLSEYESEPQYAEEEMPPPPDATTPRVA